MTETMVCPACGLDADEFAEGVCVPCRDERQAALDLHNAEHDRWERLTPAQRDAEIRREVRR